MPGKQHRVALMLQLTSPFKRHAELFAGTQRFAQEHEWIAIIDEYAADTLMSQGSQTKHYDGVIARANAPLLKLAKGLNVPVVNVWYNSPIRDDLPGVFSDWAASGRLAAEHLLSRGFRNFAVLGFDGDEGIERQSVEFRRIVRNAGCDCPMSHISLNYEKSLANWRQAESALEQWLDQWKLPVGVLINSEDVGRKTVEMCRDRGWRVPNDVAVIAGMNEPTLCENPHPTLSSIEIGYDRIGYQAAQLLHQLMRTKSKSRKRAKPEHLYLPPSGLILRKSTDFHAVDDDLVKAALDFIAEHSTQAISPDDVARGISVESRTLQRRFRKVLDRTIVAEIRRVRVERAKRELTQTNASMAAIARKVGFRQAARMYDAFIKDVGVPPSEYRGSRRIE